MNIFKIIIEIYKKSIIKKNKKFLKKFLSKKFPLSLSKNSKFVHIKKNKLIFSYKITLLINSSRTQFIIKK